MWKQKLAEVKVSKESKYFSSQNFANKHLVKAISILNILNYLQVNPVPAKENSRFEESSEHYWDIYKSNIICQQAHFNIKDNETCYDIHIYNFF